MQIALGESGSITISLKSSGSLQVILCVGEHQGDKDDGITNTILSEQLYDLNKKIRRKA